MPVLPPTELSTWASSVVGICTKSMPRAAGWPAAKPVRSPTTPPPSATSTRRDRDARQHAIQQPAESVELLAAFACRYDELAALDAGLVQGRLELRQVKRADGRVADDDGAAWLRGLGNQRAGPIQQALADQNVVGALAQCYGNGEVAHGITRRR